MGTDHNHLGRDVRVATIRVVDVIVQVDVDAIGDLVQCLIPKDVNVAVLVVRDSLRAVHGRLDGIDDDELVRKACRG